MNSSSHHIEIKKTNGRLDICIETNRLLIRSPQGKDLPSFIELRKDKKTMETYGSGPARDNEEVKKLFFEAIMKKVEDGDPFNMYFVFLKETDQFIGTITLGYGPEDTPPGKADLAYAIKFEFWGKGYATEAARAVVFGLAPKLAEDGYLIRNKPLSGLRATVIENNDRSLKILTGLGFTSENTTILRYGRLRSLYSYEIPLLRLQFQGEHNNQSYHFFKSDVCGIVESENIQEEWNNLPCLKLTNDNNFESLNF